MNKKGIIMWFILAGFFILVLTSLGIYIGLSNGGVEIGLKSEMNQTVHNITLDLISSKENKNNFTIINENNSISIVKTPQNNSIN